jgi:hypothetical protein
VSCWPENSCTVITKSREKETGVTVFSVTALHVQKITIAKKSSKNKIAHIINTDLPTPKLLKESYV